MHLYESSTINYCFISFFGSICCSFQSYGTRRSPLVLILIVRTKVTSYHNSPCLGIDLSRCRNDKLYHIIINIYIFTMIRKQEELIVPLSVNIFY